VGNWKCELSQVAGNNAFGSSLLRRMNTSHQNIDFMAVLK
jgi:hypothetical protein